jgi:hypothetical protein
MNGQIILKINSEVTDEEIELMSENLSNVRQMIYRYKILNVPEDTMKERLRLFNKVSSLLKDKERLNQMINDFNQEYALYELKKMSGADETITLVDSMIEDDKNELRLRLLDLCNAIYVSTYGTGEGIFAGVKSLKYRFERLSPNDSICKGTYVNDEEIGGVFIDNASKVIERYDERFAVIKH